MKFETKKQIDARMQREGGKKAAEGRFRAFMLKQVESEDGKAVDFPDIEVSETAEIGDRISIDGDDNATGSVTLKDGGIITYKDGIITEVDYTSNTTNAETKLSITKPQEVTKSSKGQVVKIFGKDQAGAFKIGNEVTINDKPRMNGVYTTGNLQLAVKNGKITSIKSAAKKPGTRQLFKKK